MRRILSFLPPETVAFIVQGPLRGKRWIVGSSNHGCWLGSYELVKYRRLVDEMTPHCIVYDIGANVGYYTLLAAQQADIVYAFEPLPQNINYLRRHILLNKFENVQVFETAIADFNGTGTFEAHESRAMGKLSPEGTLQVSVHRLDDLVKNQHLRPPNVLKIDVEGAEYSVLCGAQELLTISRPVLFIATHNDQVHHQCLKLLEENGYVVEDLYGESLTMTSELVAFPRIL